MKKSLFSLLTVGLLVLSSATAFADPTARIIKQGLEADVPGQDDDGHLHDMLKVNWSIIIEGAKGHIVEVQYQLLDEAGKKVYDTDNEPIFLSDETSIKENTDTITNWYGFFQEYILLKPGEHQLYTTIKLFDKTTGEYIPLEGAKKLSTTFVSEQPEPSVVVTKQEMLHNYNHHGTNSLKVVYNFDIYWFKDKEVKIVLDIYKANGTRALDKKGKPRTNSFTVTPGYNDCVFEGKWFTMAYDDFSVPRGETKFYAKLTFIDVETNKPIPTKGNNKINFSIVR